MPVNVLEPMDGDRFLVQIWKYHLAAPDTQWRNSYEIVCTSDGSQSMLTDIAVVLGQFERRIHLSNVMVSHALVSTWVADGVPYDANSFYRVPLELAGARSFAASQPLALQVTLRASMTPTSGRAGYRLYRGVLREDDVTGESGRWAFSTSSTIGGDFNAAKDESTLNEYYGPTAAAGNPLVCLIEDTGVVRQVQYFTLDRVGGKQLRNKRRPKTTP